MCRICTEPFRSELGTITQGAMVKSGTALLSTTLQATVGRVREKGRLGCPSGRNERRMKTKAYSSKIKENREELWSGKRRITEELKAVDGQFSVASKEIQTSREMDGIRMKIYSI